MFEDLLVEQMPFVEEEDGMEFLALQLDDVLTDAVEDRGCRGLRMQANGEAELAVEVTASERCVVAVRHAIRPPEVPSLPMLNPSWFVTEKNHMRLRITETL